MILDDSGDSGGCYLLKGLLKNLLDDLSGDLRLEGLDDLDGGLEGLNDLNKLGGVSGGSETCVDYYDRGMRLRRRLYNDDDEIRCKWKMMLLCSELTKRC